jgi:hypothetical protein
MLGEAPQRHVMFHKNSANVSPARNLPQPVSSLRLVAEDGTRTPAPRISSDMQHLVLIAARRGSSFLAEAAVLVLVFGILDLLIAKGHVAGIWILGALAASLGLLALSVVTDFGAHHWLKAHP